MSMFLKFLVILTTVRLNTKGLFLQSQPHTIATSENIGTREKRDVKYNRMKAVDDNNQHHVLTHSTMNKPTFHPSNSQMTYSTKLMTFQINRFTRNAETSHSDRNLPRQISTLSKEGVTQYKIRQDGKPVQRIRVSNNEKEFKFNVNVSKSTKSFSSSSGENINVIERLSTPLYNQTENSYLRFTKDAERYTRTQNNSGKYDMPFIPSPQKFPIETQQVKKASLWRNDYSFNLCSCKGTKCYYSECNINSVPQDLPTDITELYLNGNHIEILRANIFSRYPFLEILNISLNFMKSIEEGSFMGLSRLKCLDFTSNNLFVENYELPVNIFEPLKSLKILLMDGNRVYYPLHPVALDFVLSYLENVEELNIDNYIDTRQGEIFGPGFKNMTSLRNLTIVCELCPLQFVLNSTFIYLGHVTSLNIRMCGIVGKFIEAGAFSHFSRIETLDISDNNNIGMIYLPLITCGLNSSKFETFKMNSIVNGHSVTVINISVTVCMPKTVTTLSLRGNNIMFIDPEAVLKLPIKLRTIDIRDNYIVTDPQDIPLEHFVILKTLLVSSNRGECATTDDGTNLKTTLDKARIQKRKNYRREVKTTKQILEQKLNSIVLPLTLKQVKIAVEKMNDDYLLHINSENNLQEIDLSCSYLPDFTFDSFLRLSKLRSLNVRRSSIQTLTIRNPYAYMELERLILEGNHLSNFIKNCVSPFKDFIKLSYLDLSSNRLKQLPRDLFYGADQIKYLRLDSNSFFKFDVDISNMTQLKLLNLSNTELSQLPGDTRAHIDQLCKVRPGQIRVDLSDCPIQCDCFNVDFLKWMVSSTAFEKNFVGYKCKYQDTSSKNIEDGYKETIRVLERECAKNYPMFLIVLAATSVLMSTVIGAIGYRFRWKIRYLYYAAYLKIVEKQKNDKKNEFMYDVFISYDSQDHRFVTGQLAPEMEKRGLKLLIHGRDFVAGSYIASNIVTAVSESRKTLVVLTRNLLMSTWCNYELQMATMEAVHTGRPVLVFLLKENIPSRELDVELLRHIRSNTYMPYPDPEEEADADIMKRFFDKLTRDLQD